VAGAREVPRDGRADHPAAEYDGVHVRSSFKKGAATPLAAREAR
jgi:hypothetical protein